MQLSVASSVPSFRSACCISELPGHVTDLDANLWLMRSGRSSFQAKSTENKPVMDSPVSGITLNMNKNEH